jgi:hypothetical protein
VNNKNKDYNCSIDAIKSKFIENAKVKLLPDSLEISNGTVSVSGEDIIKSSLAQETMEDLTTQNGTNKFINFNLKRVENHNKNITLIGNIEGGSLEQDTIILKLGKTNYECSANQTTIEFEPKNFINEHLHGKVANLTNNNFLLIYVKDTEKTKDIVNYNSNNNLFLELISAGNFTQDLSDKKKNATANLYFRGSQDILSVLRPYISFTALATYDRKKLRNLEGPLNITAYGKKIDNGNDKDIIIYNIEYKDTSDKNILKLTSNNDYQFFQYPDYNNPETFDLQFDKSEINLMNENPEVPEPITYKEFKPSKTSFELDFNANSNLKLESNISDSYLKFPTVLFGNETKEIKCSLTNKTKNVDYYKMVCSTREKINAQVKNLKIKFPVKKKLRILADETSYNKTLYFNNEKENEIITYEYDGDSKDFFGRKKKNGLSAGAIVAIILASVAVVVAVGIVFIFLNKRTNTPPFVKNQPDFNIVNSTSNINN